MLNKLMLAALASATLIGSAHGRPARDNEVIYFSDRTMRTEVGSFYMSCGGTVVRTGVTTPYWVRYQEPCDGFNVGPYGPECRIDGVIQTCPPGVWLFSGQP